MSTDPSSRIARRLVRLVVLAVALPSLVLTGMGLLAIDNERAAAKQRLEEAYQPILLQVAARFNAALAALPDESAAALEELWAGSAGGAVEPGALDAFVAEHPYALNYFVLADGVARPWAGVRRPWSDEQRAALLAAAEELERNGSVDVALYTRLQTLAIALAAPARAPLDDGISAILDRLRRRLAELAEPEALVTLATLEMSRSGAELGAAVARLALPADVDATIVNPVVDEWRRVVFLRKVGAGWAGFELAPAGFAPLLAAAVAELGLADRVGAEVYAITLPKAALAQKEKLDHQAMAARVLAWALLKQTNLTWELNLLRRGEAPLWNLNYSRVPFYLWALVLAVLVLVAGIVVTLRTVVREARFARLKTDFVSSVSHDLRTPLTSIRMFTETLLLGRVRSEEERREALETIAQETERLTRLTARILDFSRMEAGRKAYTFAPTDLGAIVRRAVAACKPLIDEGGFTVTLELADGLPAVAADSDALTEVVINLLTNAIKYSPDERRIVVRLRGDGAEVVLEVIDHGIGIPRAEQQRIFEKFYRVDCRRTTEVGGSGIGLSLVQHIVTAHRGQVVVESTPGAGSTFAVRLPAAPSAGSDDGADPGHRG